MGMYEMNCTMICAVGGAIFYLYTNRWLEEKLGGDHDDTPIAAIEDPEVQRLKMVAGPDSGFSGFSERPDTPGSHFPVRQLSDLSESSRLPSDIAFVKSGVLREDSRLSDGPGGRGAMKALQKTKQLDAERKRVEARMRWQKT